MDYLLLIRLDQFTAVCCVMGSFGRAGFQDYETLIMVWWHFLVNGAAWQRFAKYEIFGVLCGSA